MRREITFAGSPAACEIVGAIALELGVTVHPVPVGRDAKVIDGTTASELESVEFFWCHGRFSGDWVNNAIDQFPNLKWIHSDFVGIDAMPTAKLRQRGLVLSNGGDNFARPMAEWSMMGVLAGAKRFAHYQRNSQSGVWDPSVPLDQVGRRKLFLAGLGSVNSLVARMATAFEMEVTAWTRGPRESMPVGVDHHIFGGSVPSEIADADAVVVGLPLTATTRHIFDRTVLDRLKDGVTLVNPARGALFDEVALSEAIETGKIGYALLDAFEVEPLGDRSPLWHNPRVTVYPHQSWSSPEVSDNAISRMRAQFELWMAGADLDGSVDLEAGY